MIVVREVSPGQFERLVGNPVLTSLDGQRKAPLVTILHPSWTPEERAAFGVYFAEPMEVPEGKQKVGAPRFERHGDDIVEVYDLQDMPLENLPPLSARQIRLALFHAGKLEAVEQAVQQIGGAVAIEWEYATEFERTNAKLLAVAESLGLTPQEVDDLWKIGLSL